MALPARTYVVSYEKVDVWLVEVEAPNKREAKRMVENGEFDLDDTTFNYHGGQGRIVEVRRDG